MTFELFFLLQSLSTLIPNAIICPVRVVFSSDSRQAKGYYGPPLSVQRPCLPTLTVNLLKIMHALFLINKKQRRATPK
jgi:hypothetical protein